MFSRRLPSLAFSAAVLAAATTPLGGCLLAAVGAGAGAVGYTTGNERGIGGTATDTGIKASVNAIWARDDDRIASYVDLNIFEGRVLLTGNVPDPKLRDEAVAGAWKASGVKEVINEIQLAQGASFSTAAGDNWILARLNSDMVFDGIVRTPNYSLQCVSGTVYILGISRTQAEMDHVLNYARNIPNVRQVKSYIRIRSGIGEDGSTQLGTTGGNQPPSALSPADSQQGYQQGYQPGTSQPASGGQYGGYSPGDSRDPALNGGGTMAPPPPSAPPSSSSGIQVTPLQ